MSAVRSSSKRRLAFTTPQISQPATACNQVHTKLCTPMSWRCRELVTTLGINASLVCPCRKDISRFKIDPCHCPRWEKENISACSIPLCRNKFFANLPMSDIAQCLELAGDPHCQTQPHPFANIIIIPCITHRPTLTHCPTVGIGL